MKIGSAAVLGVHIAALCAFSLTQGCVTSDTGGKRIAGARVVKGPFKHVHQGKSDDDMMPMQQPMDFGQGAPLDAPLYPVDPINTTDITPIKPSTPTESYLVRKGDTLSQLAVDFDTTTAELMRLNNLSNPDVLYVGQELQVPAGRGAAKKSASRSGSSVKKGGTYVIQPGDTLSEIALAAGVSIDALREVNGIKGDMIRAGDELTIPAGGKVPTTVKASKPKAPKKEAPAPAKEPEVALPDLEPAVPMIEDAPAAETASAPAAGSSSMIIEEVVVYPGDTLDKIARDYGVTKAEIMEWNGIADESEVREGTTLRIRISE